jgi:RNA polymerase sigma factor (sigma-70 family)
MGSPTFSIEELLAHADWLRRLARQVAGEQAADDAVQDTWVAALRAAPRRDGIAEPWLAEVLRNFVRRALRSERARGHREARARRDPALAPAAAATPEVLLERAEAQRALVDLVLALDEPFRSTVLLRYHEGLSAAGIARAQGLPAGTVRWRLKEALDRLRAAMEAGRPDRRWVLLFVPLRAPGGGWKGALMATTAQKKIAGALVVLVLALAGGGLVWRPLGRGARLHSSPTDGGVSRLPAASALRPPSFVPAITAPSGEAARDESAAGSVDGQVVSAVDGVGVVEAQLSFALGESSLTVSADLQGRFRFVPGEAGTYLLARVAADGYRPFSPEWGDSPISFALRAQERIRGVKLALHPIRTCRGRVVDQAGRPVARAQVRLYEPMRATAPPPVESETDRQGEFDFIARAGAFVEAHQGERMARDQVGYSVVSRCALVLRLGDARPTAPLAIRGRLEGAGSAPVVGAVVQAWTNPALEPAARHGFARAVSGADGRFVLAPLEAISYQLTAAMGGQEVASAANVPGGSEGVVLRVPAPGRLRGTVQDENGAPVASFSVVLSRPSSDDVEGARISTVYTRHDARGTFELDGISAGSYRALATTSGRAPSADQTVEVKPDPAPATEIRFVLAAGSKARGRVTDRATGQPIAGASVSLEGRAGVGSAVPLSSGVQTGEDGRFELGGLPPGRLSMMVSAAGHHARLLGALEARPGQDLGPLLVALTPTRQGEDAHIELVGIGVSVAPRDGLAVIGQVLPGGGADQAGLVAGDALVAIDGRTVADLGFGAAMEQIRGVEGTTVLLRVRRVADGKDVELMVTRQLVRGF